MSKIFNFQKKLISQTFLNQIKDESLSIKIKGLILDGYTFRINNQLSQEQFSIFRNMSLNTIKRIELGQCINLKLIEKYAGVK